MDLLWDGGRPVAVREVLDDLAPERPLAYTTVMTVLDHLHSKGFVRREKQGRAFRYSPTSTREEYAAGVLGEVLADTRDRGATLMHFVGRMSAAELAELRSALSGVGDEDPGARS